MKSLVFRSLQNFAKFAKQPRMALVSTKSYDIEYFNKINGERPKEKQIYIQYFNELLNTDFAKTLKGFDIVCPFVNDRLDASCLDTLKSVGVDLIALRCAGFNNVDLAKAKSAGFGVVRVPTYSPQAVAEHALALIQTINRRTHRAHDRVRNSNFSIEGFIGFDLYKKTAGIVGMGKIGQAFAAICQGLGMNIVVFDPIPQDAQLLAKFGAKQVDMDTLFRESDVLSLHCPLTPETKHIVNKANMEKMKSHAIIANTGRGGLVNAKDAIWALKAKKIGGLGIDVYEFESGLFFNDLNNEIVQDDDLMRLTTFPNVAITAHQAFLTEEALTSISNVTLDNIFEYRTTGKCKNSVI